MISFLDITPNLLSKFSSKHWLGINDNSRGKHNTNFEAGETKVLRQTNRTNNKSSNIKLCPIYRLYN